jgi:hypothetical protein
MVALGLALHSAAGGPSGTGPAVAAVFLVAILLTRAVHGKSGSPGRMTILLVQGQLAVHMAASPMNHPPAGSMTHAMATDATVMTHAGMLRRSGEAYGPKIADAVGAALGCLFASPGMLIAHLAAAAAVAWWLTAGERLCLRAAAVLSGYSAHTRAALLLAARRGFARSQSAVRPIVGAPATPVRHLFLVCGNTLRGPPVVG